MRVTASRLTSMARLRRTWWSSPLTQKWTWLWSAGISLGTTGCLVGPTQGHSGATDVNQETPQSDSSADANTEAQAEVEDTGEPTAQAGEGESADKLRFEGEMDVTYTYDGSFGEFADVCDGAAFVFIEDDTIEGEGICENDFITFGFVIEGLADDGTLEGILIAESSMGRAETPYEGEWDGEEIQLSFDHTHEADGESLRLEGVISLAQDE